MRSSVFLLLSVGVALTCADLSPGQCPKPKAGSVHATDLQIHKFYYAVLRTKGNILYPGSCNRDVKTIQGGTYIGFNQGILNGTYTMTYKFNIYELDGQLTLNLTLENVTNLGYELPHSLQATALLTTRTCLVIWSCINIGEKHLVIAEGFALHKTITVEERMLMLKAFQNNNIPEKTIENVRQTSCSY